MRILLFILVVITLSGWGCEEQIEWDLDAKDSDILVVDGGITNESTNHLVRLSLSNANSNEGFRPATGAFVFITDGNGSVALTEFPANSGNYYTPVVQAVVDNQYVLFVSYRGEEYLAADTAVPVDPLAPINIFPVDSLYTIFPQDGSNPSLTRHVMTWEHTSYCNPGDICFGKFNYYDLKTVDVNNLFSPEKDPLLFPRNTIIVRRKFSLSENYRSYLRAMLSETEWRGGQFDVEKGNVFSNVTNGGLGFFSASMVDSDTTVAF